MARHICAAAAWIARRFRSLMPVWTESEQDFFDAVRGAGIREIWIKPDMLPGTRRIPASGNFFYRVVYGTRGSRVLYADDRRATGGTRACETHDDFIMQTILYVAQDAERVRAAHPELAVTLLDHENRPLGDEALDALRKRAAARTREGG